MSDPIRVLELGGGVSSAYAAKLLGDEGADVVKVESPEGDRTRRCGPFPGDTEDPEKSGLFLALNLNKRGVSIDLDSEAGRDELARLIAWAEILVHSFPRAQAAELGLDPEALDEQRPDLVTVSITPFGASGHYSDYRGTELSVAHGSGWAGLCPVTHKEVELPPLKVFGEVCGMITGVTGAMTALASLRDARRSGVGEFIDLSEQEMIASIIEGNLGAYSYGGEIARRYGERGLIPWKIFDASDGKIYLICVEDDQWQRLCELMGDPDWAGAEIFADSVGRADNQDLIHELVQDFISEWTVADFFREAQKLRICCAPVLNLEQLGASEHLRSRDFFVTVDHPRTGPLEYMAPAVSSNSGRRGYDRPAPLLGQHTSEVLGQIRPLAKPETNAAPRLPLEGIRVVDLAWVWAGAYCSMNLANLGAEVIRFESEDRPDFYRRAGPWIPGEEFELNRSFQFNQWNQGKKSVRTDLGSPRGLELVKEFVAKSDVVVQNFSTGVLERLGLGYDVLKEINPGIVLASISGYGQTGPLKDYMGYGPAVASLTGLCSVTGFIGGEAEELGISLPDPTVGVTAALAVVAALERRESTGLGDHVDGTLWEATAVLAAQPWMDQVFNGHQPEPMANRDLWMAPHGCFPCRGEDEWVSIACANDGEWAQLCSLIEPALSQDARFADLQARKANEDALEAIVSDWTRERDRWEITRSLQAMGIAAFPSLSTKDVIEDPHLNARGFIEHLPHPEVGNRAHAGIPWRLRKRPNGIRMAAPCLGADTEAVLGEVLGYDAKAIAEIRNS